MITTPRRLGALALIAAIGLGACSSSGASTVARSVSRRPDHGDQRGALGRRRVGRPEHRRPAPVPPSASVTLQGAGATFPAPLYDSWFQTFNGRLPERPDRLPGQRLRRRHQGHHRGDRRLRRLGRRDEGRGDRGPAVRHEDAPLPDRARRGRHDLQPAGRAQAPARRRPTSPGSTWARSRSGTTRRSPPTTRA